MSVMRLFAILFIFGCTAVAWFLLGTSLVVRTGESDQALAREVAQLWGGLHRQVAPSASLQRVRQETAVVKENNPQGQVLYRESTTTVTDSIPVPPESSRIQVVLRLDQRRKGLLWYDTYAVDFNAQYRFRNTDPVERPVRVRFDFSSKEAIYDGFVFKVGGSDVPFTGDLSAGMTTEVTLPAGAETLVELAYRSRGLDRWTYAFTGEGVAEIKNLAMTMTTDFEEIDFPAGTMSPTTRTRAGAGWSLAWDFTNLVTGSQIGMDLPNRINPGPLASRITFFAPVSLLFFTTVMVILGLLRNRSLHPMNYFFLSAAFFSFHLLLAYLVDHVSVHTAFVLAAAVSIALVVSYLRLVGGMRLALREAGLAQLVFLVLFSYAFFFEGYTGLTVTVGSILTLFVLMQLTGRVNWNEVFARQRAAG